MSYRTRRPYRQLLRAGVAGVALAMVVAACGGTDGKNQAKEPELAIAKKVVLSKAPMDQWAGPTKAVKPPDGATVTILSCGSADFSCTATAAAAKTAAEELGWQATVVDGKMSPKLWNTAVKTAVGQGVDVLILAGTGPAQMSKAITDARAAGIPVVATSYPAADDAPELDGHVTIDYAASGTIMAGYFIEESGGTKRIKVMEMEAEPDVETRSTPFYSKVKKECPTCDMSRDFWKIDEAPADIAYKLGSALFVSNPKSEYLLVPVESFEKPVLEGIESFRKEAPDVVLPQLVGFGSSPETAKRIRSGAQAATLASPATYMGWLAIDQTARLLADQSPKKVHVVPERLITKDNVDALDGGEGWQTEHDFKAKFLDLWGVVVPTPEVESQTPGT